MKNIFKRHNKTEDQPKEVGGIEQVKKHSQETVDNFSAPKTEQQEEFDFNVILENLNKLIEITKELDSTLNAKDIEQVAHMPVQELMRLLSGKKVEINTSGKELMETIQFAIKATEGKADRGAIQKFADDPIKRAVLLFLILTGKFMPHAHGADNTSKIKDNEFTKKEATFTQNTEPDPNTYTSTLDELNGNHNYEKVKDAKDLESKVEGDRNVFSLNLTNHFNTDSEKIIETDKAAIEKDVRDFLSLLTPQSAEKILASKISVLGSCDERGTPKWETNENLDKARVGETSDFIESIFKDPGATKHLPKDISLQFQHKKVERDIFESKTGPDKGVKYITDLVNPDTGKNFTQEEVGKIKDEAKKSDEGSAKLLKLYSECRGVIFSVKAINDDLSKIKPIPGKLDLKNPVPSVEKWLGGYHNIIIVADNTPSIKDGGGHLPSNIYIAKIISEIKTLDDAKKYYFGSFDSGGLKMDSFKQVKDLQEVSKDIKELDGRGDGTKEASLTSAIQAIDKIDYIQGEKTVIKILTDEPLQDFSVSKFYKLQRMAIEKNVTVSFCYGDDENGTLNEISLEEGGKILQDNILKLNGHPSVDQILKANEKVEDHLGQIFAPLISKNASETIKWYSLAAKNNIKYNDNHLKSDQEKIDRYKKIIESSKDKNSNNYKNALLMLSNAETSKNSYENESANYLENEKICNEYGPELKILADAYISNNDKTILSHPYFAIFSGLINEKNYFSNQKEVTIGTDKFVNKIELGKNNQ